MATKKEMFVAIKAVVADNAEFVAFLDKEITALDKRKASVDKAAQEKKAANAAVAEEVTQALANADKPLSGAEVGEIVGISAQKAVYILNNLVEGIKVEKEGGKKSGKNLYSLN